MGQLIQGNRNLLSTNQGVVQLQEEIAKLSREKRAVEAIYKSERAKSAEIKSLSGEKARLRDEISQLRAQVRDVHSNSDEEHREAELQRILHEKDREIQALRAQIDNLRTEQSINSNSFLEQRHALADAVQAKQQMEQIVSKFEQDNAALATGNQKLAGENAELRRLSQHLQKKFEQLSVAYSHCVHEKMVLGKRLRHTHRRNLVQLQTLRGVEQQLTSILGACHVSGPDEFGEFVSRQRGALRRYRTKYFEVAQALTDVTERNTKLEGLWRVQSDENDRAKNQVAELLQTQQDLLNERLKLRATLEHLGRRDRVGSLFEAANAQMCRDVNAIRTALSLPNGPSLRPLILVILALRHWQGLVGDPGLSAEIAVNRSWMEHPGVAEILDAIRRIRGEGVVYNRELDQLKLSCLEKDNSIARLSERVEQFTGTEQAQLSRIAELEKAVEEQSRVADDRVDRIRQKCLEGKQFVREAQEELKRRADRIQVLEREKHDMDSGRNESAERTEKAESELEVAAAQIKEQNAELELIRHQLHARNREIVALEKINEAFRDDARIRSVHVESLARVAQGRAHNPVDAEVNLASQLREMAQNLSGTLCD
jgi:chromosome segregation ATPase